MALSDGAPCVVIIGADGRPVAYGPAAAISDGAPCLIVQGADGRPVAVGGVASLSDGAPGMAVQAADGRTVGLQLASACPDGSPSIFVSVTGETGIAYWLDLSWDFDDGDSGWEYEVCPTYYLFDAFGDHYWSYVGYLGESILSLRRYVVGDPDEVNGGFFSENNLYAQINPSDYAGDSQYWNGAGTQIVDTSELGLMSQPRPTLAAYKITDDFFGSYVGADGYTYSWRRGNGWPRP